MKKPSLKIENPDLLYETAEDITDEDEEDITEDHSDTQSPSDKLFSNGNIATIDYDRLYEDMIFPS
jgi:hypothetical protein